MNIPLFLEKQTKNIQELEIKSRLAWWNLAVTGDKIYTSELQDAEKALKKLYSNPEDYKWLQDHLGKGDLLQNRQLQLLLYRYAENLIEPDLLAKMVDLETEIETIYTNFRPSVKDKLLSNNELKDILLNSINIKEREEAWFASKKIGEEVSQKILELVHLRNQTAKKAGFSNYYQMRLYNQEIEEKELFDLLDELEQTTKERWDTFIEDFTVSIKDKYKLDSNDLYPWFVSDPFFQEAPKTNYSLDPFYKDKDIVDISRNYYAFINLPVDDILHRSDLFERKGKNQHAFCTSIDQELDIRILCNIRDNEYWMSTQLHELGHAVYDKYIDPNLPYLLRIPAHISVTESIAMLFGRLGKNSDFINAFANVESSDLQTIKSQIDKQLGISLLIFTRWVMVMVHFEKALYENPHQDLNKLWWDLVEKFQSLKRPIHRNAPDWASKLHIACAPVYYQNYLLGEMMASQLIHSFKEEKQEGKNWFSNKALGEWLKAKVFKDGAKYPWQELIKRATNHKLSSNYFIKDLI
ncbi:MAG: hypothetical protein BGO10_08920 [Chlamydia sp. 32-24]|nr:MAG: hypothetical protein BGO10_08920 [Chlamydia sp. 32-24]